MGDSLLSQPWGAGTVLLWGCLAHLCAAHMVLQHPPIKVVGQPLGRPERPGGRHGSFFRGKEDCLQARQVL